MEVVEESVRKTEVFQVEQKPMFYSREYGKYLQDPRWKPLQHKKVVERAIHFWFKLLMFNSLPARTCFDAPGDIKSTHPA